MTRTGIPLTVEDSREGAGKKKGLLHRFRNQIISILKQKAPPHRIALGGALGIFVGMLPIMGIQMAVVSILALPLRGNLKAAIAGVWISNPLTFIPLYYACYRFGLIFFPNHEVSWEEFSGVITHAAEWDWSAIKASFSNLINMGADILVPLWGGSAILGFFFGAATYLVLLFFVVKYRARKE